MSLVGCDRLTGLVGFPRVSGDEPAATEATRGAALFSPRERG